jgi:hypothetical protein
MCMNTLLQAALEAAQQLGTAAEQWATADASSLSAQQAARDAARAADEAKLIKAEALSRAHAALDALAGETSVSGMPAGEQAAIFGGDRDGPFKRLMDRKRKEIADGLVSQGVPREVATDTARQLGDGTILRLILEYGPAFIQAIINLFGLAKQGP